MKNAGFEPKATAAILFSHALLKKNDDSKLIEYGGRKVNSMKEYITGK